MTETAKKPDLEAVARMRDAMLESLSGIEMDRLSLDDLRDAMHRPGALETAAELMALEPQSVQQGEPAPDFDLPRLGAERAAGETVSLSRHFGDRPVALIFGSYT